MASSSEPLDLIVTVLSAKHLKNVNWRNGDLKPYVVLYLDPDHRLSTRSDESIKPVWNERITLPLTRSVHESVLNIEIFHSNSSDSAKALVGSGRCPLVDSEGTMMTGSIHSIELVRPSGRIQGKIRLKLEIKKRPIQPQNYYSAPQGSSYYPPQREYRDFSPSPYPLTDHYYSRFYYPPPPRSLYDRASNYSLPSVPSAEPNAPPPRFSNYAPLPSGPPSAPLDAFPVNEAPQPSGPSAPVDAFPVNEYNKPQDPPVSSRFSSYEVRLPPRSMYDRASNYSLPSVPSAEPNAPPPRFSNYAPPPSGPPSAPVDSFPVNEAPQPSGPSAPVDEYNPPVSSRFSSYEVRLPRGPSAPVDYSPYDHRQLHMTMGGLSLEEERAVVERSETESEFGPRPSCSRDYRREC